MRRALRLILCVFSIFVVLVGSTSAQSTKIETATFTALAQSERVRVIITLTDPAQANTPPAQRHALVASAQRGVVTRLQAKGGRILRRYAQVPALVADVNAAALAALISDPTVLYVQVDQEGGAMTTESVPAIGANLVHSTYGLTGAGVRVAVIDSGIDTDHPDLADDLVAQACFTGAGSPSLSSCPPGNTVTGTSAEDANGHGTNVTGIITSKGTIAPLGFAPDADIISIRVLNAGGTGFVSDWVAALDWLLANQETLRTDIVNMSLGTFVTYAPNCDAEQPAMASAINLLRNYYGIPTFVATGNQGESFTVAAPACIANSIAVGATYDSDLGREPDTGTWRTRFGSGWPLCFDAATSISVLTCFTNGGAAVDLVAPGVYITSTGLGGITSRYAGTSQAAPTAAGVAALMLQARPALSPDAIETILETTGVPLTDTRNGLTYPRVDAYAAVTSAMTILPTPVQVAPINRAVTGLLPTFTWSHVDGADAYYFWLSRADGAKVYDVWLNPADYCDATTCNFESYFELLPGIHRWWIQAWDTIHGYSQWSPAALFEASSE